MMSENHGEEKVLAMLDSVVEGVGGFEKIEEFGYVFDDEITVWSYDIKSRSLALDRRYIEQIWKEAKRRKESTATLLLSGDSYTAWNRRKRRLVRYWNEKERSHELAFNSVVLRKHPKAATAWSHRRWCLLRDKEVLSVESIGPELELCSMLAERYPRNYCAWTHRTWLVQQITRAHRVSHLENEHIFVQAWLHRHVTDYSALAFAIYIALFTDSTQKPLNDLLLLQTALAQLYPHLASNPVGTLAYLKRATSSLLLSSAA